MSVIDPYSSELTLGEALKTLVQSLQLTTLLPAILLVGLIVFFFFPSPNELDSLPIGLLVFAVITLSFLLHALNMPIIRFWEGYILGNTRLMQELRSRQLDVFDELHDAVGYYESLMDEIDGLLDELYRNEPVDEQTEQELENWKQGWEDHQRELLERLEDRFPPHKRQVLPTSLGNTIHAFERYSFERYGIDSIQLWTRFVPLLAENKYAAFIQNEKTILDFLVNMLSVGVVIAGISLFKFGISGDLVALGILIGVVGTIYVLFKAAVVASANWGTTVKAAFDLYRHDLRSSLCLRLPEPSLEGERTMWRGVSDFLAFNNTQTFQGFVYALPKSPQQDDQSGPADHLRQEENHGDQA